MNSLITALRTHFPEKRVISDELRRLAWGTDASFYRLIPRVVVIVENEADVAHVLAVARQENIHLTFRAAGTSLSGQAVTDGILVLIGEGSVSYTHLDVYKRQVLGIPLAALGLLNPVIAGAAMAMSSVSVVSNSLLLKRWRPGSR